MPASAAATIFCGNVCVACWPSDGLAMARRFWNIFKKAFLSRTSLEQLVNVSSLPSLTYQSFHLYHGCLRLSNSVQAMRTQARWSALVKLGIAVRRPAPPCEGLIAGQFHNERGMSHRQRVSIITVTARGHLMLAIACPSDDLTSLDRRGRARTFATQFQDVTRATHSASQIRLTRVQCVSRE